MFTGAVTLLFQVVVSTGLVRVGLNFALNGNSANVYAHVVVVRKHMWRTLCSVGATGARVAQSFPFLEVFTGAVTLMFQVVVSLGLVRVGLNFPLIEKCTNTHGHMTVVRGHVL